MILLRTGRGATASQSFSTASAGRNGGVSESSAQSGNKHGREGRWTFSSLFGPPYGYPLPHNPCCPVPAIRRIYGGRSPGTQPGRSKGSDWWLLAPVSWLCWARRDAAQGSLWLDPHSLARLPSAASPSGSGYCVVGALWSVSRHALIALPMPGFRSRLARHSLWWRLACIG